MQLSHLQDYLQALACPACASHGLLLTKERIIICQGCLNGYKLIGDTPDFRLSNAISFKKKISPNAKGLNAVFTVLLGENKNQSFDVKLGYSVVIGRRMAHESEPDLTFVGRPQVASYTQIDSANRQLIDKYLSSKKESQSQDDSIFDSQKKFLGDYMRDPDFLISDQSVSRAHAIVYQNEDGVHILDLVSRNGTYVNSFEVESCKLKNNDVISFGTASLRLNFY